MLTILASLSAKLSDEDGATMLEYGIMITVIALIVMLGATALGLAVDLIFTDAEALL